MGTHQNRGFLLPESCIEALIPEGSSTLSLSQTTHCHPQIPWSICKTSTLKAQTQGLFSYPSMSTHGPIHLSSLSVILVGWGVQPLVLQALQLSAFLAGSGNHMGIPGMALSL